MVEADELFLKSIAGYTGERRFPSYTFPMAQVLSHSHTMTPFDAPWKLKRILKINSSWTELFNFQNSFNCH